jgi:hypothetical protein
MHVELDIAMLSDNTYGRYWESFVVNLVTFNFRFKLLLDIYDQYNHASILAPYTTPFWLEQKRWFVACDTSENLPSVFTVPRSAPTKMRWPSIGQPIRCTSSNINLQENIRCLIWTIDIGFDLFVLPKITSLTLVKGQGFSTKVLLSMTDLSQRLPFSNSLTLSTSVLIYFPNNFVFNQVQTLVVHDDGDHINPHIIIDVQYLSKAFPRLKRLNMPVKCSEDLFHLFDNLRYLSFATFYCGFDLSIFSYQLRTDIMLRYWLMYTCRRLWMNPSFSSHINKQILTVWVSSYP